MAVVFALTQEIRVAFRTTKVEPVHNERRGQPTNHLDIAILRCHCDPQLANLDPIPTYEVGRLLHAPTPLPPLPPLPLEHSSLSVDSVQMLGEWSKRPPDITRCTWLRMIRASSTCRDCEGHGGGSPQSRESARDRPTMELLVLI
jgi:hypothetical protein